MRTRRPAGSSRPLTTCPVTVRRSFIGPSPDVALRTSATTPTASTTASTTAAPIHRRRRRTPPLPTPDPPGGAGTIPASATMVMLPQLRRTGQSGTYRPGPATGAGIAVDDAAVAGPGRSPHPYLDAAEGDHVAANELPA